MSDSLPKRLRDFDEFLRVKHPQKGLCGMAADEIEQLEQENARLREERDSFERWLIAWVEQEGAQAEEVKG